MTEAIFNQGNEDPLQGAKAFMTQLMTHFGTIQQALEENVQLRQRVAVLEELVEVMKDQMQDSKRVKLDGFGSFKIGIESKGAQTAGKFTVAEHITGLHVVFMPERTTDSGGNKSKQFLQGAKVEELPLNTVVKEEP